MDEFVWSRQRILNITSQSELESKLPNCNVAASISYAHLVNILESGTKTKPIFRKHPVEKAIHTYRQALPSLIKICERDNLFEKAPLPPGVTMIRYSRIAPVTASYEPLYEALLKQFMVFNPVMRPVYGVYQDLKQNHLIADIFWNLNSPVRR